MEKYGYRKGSMKRALEEAMRRYASPGRSDWDALVGTLKINKDSVWGQHHAWDVTD